MKDSEPLNGGSIQFFEFCFTLFQRSPDCSNFLDIDMRIAFFLCIPSEAKDPVNALGNNPFIKGSPANVNFYFFI